MGTIHEAMGLCSMPACSERVTGGLRTPAGIHWYCSEHASRMRVACSEALRTGTMGGDMSNGQRCEEILILGDGEQCGNLAAVGENYCAPHARQRSGMAAALSTVLNERYRAQRNEREQGRDWWDTRTHKAKAPDGW